MGRSSVISIVAAGLLAGGCVHSVSVPQTGTDHPSGWSDQKRAAATETYSYALLANNAYSEGLVGDLPGFREVGGKDNDSRGFAYKVFERLEGDRAVERIIAFRGTELHDLKDMFWGNLLGAQNRRGLRVYDEWSGTPEGIPVTVVGHSLGGAIATHVSLRRGGVNSYIFNASPRFRRKGPQPRNRRLSVAEQGELLKAVRIFGREANQLYIPIGCTHRRGPLTQHRIYPLAACLTQIAAISCRAAGQVLERNPELRRAKGPWPQTEEDASRDRCVRVPVAAGTLSLPHELWRPLE